MTFPNTLVPNSHQSKDNKMRDIIVAGTIAFTAFASTMEWTYEGINLDPRYQPEEHPFPLHYENEVPKGGIRHVTYPGYADIGTPAIATGTQMATDSGKKIIVESRILLNESQDKEDGILLLTETEEPQNRSAFVIFKPKKL
jgi:hypothetical protein